MDRFGALPEDCISHILSLTSPLDAGRSSKVSWGFQSAADSDTLWKRFLPSDYEDIISRSTTPVDVNSTKKQLYLRLSDSPPIVLDGGTLSFSLERGSGKKCYMLGARKLSIVWGATPQYWEWASHPESRFSEVAVLLGLSYLDIRGRIYTRMLSPKTTYAAYLVFQLAGWLDALESAEVSIRSVNHESEEEAEDRASTIYFLIQGDNGGPGPQQRMDGWMEIEMGEFYNDQCDDYSEVEARLMSTEMSAWKSGLIVEGNEFRPKN